MAGAAPWNSAPRGFRHGRRPLPRRGDHRPRPPGLLGRLHGRGPRPLGPVPFPGPVRRRRPPGARRHGPHRGDARLSGPRPLPGQPRESGRPKRGGDRPGRPGAGCGPGSRCGLGAGCGQGPERRLSPERGPAPGCGPGLGRGPPTRDPASQGSPARRDPGALDGRGLRRRALPVPGPYGHRGLPRTALSGRDPPRAVRPLHAGGPDLLRVAGGWP